MHKLPQNELNPFSIGQSRTLFLAMELQLITRMESQEPNNN